MVLYHLEKSRRGIHVSCRIHPDPSTVPAQQVCLYSRVWGSQTLWRIPQSTESVPSFYRMCLLMCYLEIGSGVNNKNKDPVALKLVNILTTECVWEESGGDIQKRRSEVQREMSRMRWKGKTKGLTEIGMKRGYEGAWRVKGLEVVWATVSLWLKPSLLCECAPIGQGAWPETCLSSFTKHGHITETQWRFPLSTTAHIHSVDLTHAEGEYHHLHVVYTQKHTCMSQKYIVCHHLIQQYFYHKPTKKHVQFTSRICKCLLSVSCVCRTFELNEFMSVAARSPLYEVQCLFSAYEHKPVTILSKF